MRCALGLVFLVACGEVSSRVDGPPGDTGPVTVTFTTQRGDGAVANTGFVAYQDGDGPWQVVTGAAGVYTLTVASGRYGVLNACERAEDGSTFVDVGFFATSDGAARFGFDQCTSASSPRVPISGTVAGVPSDQRVFISGSASSLSAPPGNWSMPVLAGPGTLIGMRTAGERPLGMLFQRVTFAAGATFALDFGAEFFPAESQLTLDPTAANPFMMTTYIDENGFQHRIDVSSTAVTTYRVVPGDRVGNGVSLLTQTSGGGGAFRNLQRAFKTPVAQTMTLPAAYLPASPPRFAATVPYPIAAVTLPVRAGASHYLASYFSTNGLQFHGWDVLHSAAWVGAGASFESRMPDVSALAGWKAAYALVAEESPDWSVSIWTGRVVPGAAAFGINGASTAPILDGDETTTSMTSGSFD